MAEGRVYWQTVLIYFRSKTWVITTMPKAASLTLKWSIVTKSWKKGRISSILSSSHWFRNSMALKQKNIIKSIKFIIYNRYIEEQFYPWFKFLFTSSESPKMVTNRQTLLQSNYIFPGTQIPNPNKLNTNTNWSVQFSRTDLHHHILTFGFAPSQGWSGIISEAVYGKVPHAMHTHYLNLVSFQQLLSHSSLFMWNFIFKHLTRLFSGNTLQNLISLSFVPQNIWL